MHRTGGHNIVHDQYNVVNVSKNSKVAVEVLRKPSFLMVLGSGGMLGINEVSFELVVPDYRFNSWS